MATDEVLKRDAFGSIRIDSSGPAPVVVRDAAEASGGCRALARRLVRREAAALLHLAERGVDGVPRLLEVQAAMLRRSWLPGRAMHRARPDSPAYFQDALRLLRCLHAAGVAHNDLAKEANWICAADGRAGLVDFQLASIHPRRSAWFRLLAREDLRHLLKHKRQYAAQALTARQRALLARPAWPSRCWRLAVKPVYRLVTRRMLGWPERYSADERGQVSSR
jgi:RIO-like serine/threonine protein kinase